MPLVTIPPFALPSLLYISDPRRGLGASGAPGFSTAASRYADRITSRQNLCEAHGGGGRQGERQKRPTLLLTPFDHPTRRVFQVVLLICPTGHRKVACKQPHGFCGVYASGESRAAVTKGAFLVLAAAPAEVRDTNKTCGHVFSMDNYIVCSRYGTTFDVVFWGDSRPMRQFCHNRLHTCALRCAEMCEEQGKYGDEDACADI